MGLQPKLTEIKVMEVLTQWKKEKDIMSLFKNHWFPLEEKLYKMFIGLVGAASTEEVCLGSSLTVNFHQMIATFYKPL
jgi:kynureninase